MTDWQPIETAPKDGDGILCFKPDEPRSGDWIAVCYFDWDNCLGYETGPQWVFVGGLGAGNPTHWMPLPEPPTKAPQPR